MAAVFGQPLRERERVHRSCACPADAFETQVLVLKQAIEDTPGGCPKGTPALQGQVQSTSTQWGSEV